MSFTLSIHCIGALSVRSFVRLSICPFVSPLDGSIVVSVRFVTLHYILVSVYRY